jgi:DNA polymerase-4
VTEKQLAEIGIRRIRDLAGMEEKFLEKRFGKWGLALAGKAKGADAGGWFDAPIGANEAPKSISHEHTFSEDTKEQGVLEATLLHLTEKVMRRLREHGFYARGVQLKLRLADFSTITRAQTLTDPSDVDRRVGESVLQLFRENWSPGAAIRLLGVQVSQFSDKAPQQNLLTGKEDAKWRKALQAADRLRDKFGEDKMHLGGALRGVYKDRVHEAAPKDPRKKE